MRDGDHGAPAIDILYTDAIFIIRPRYSATYFHLSASSWFVCLYRNGHLSWPGARGQPGAYGYW